MGNSAALKLAQGSRELLEELGKGRKASEVKVSSILSDFGDEVAHIHLHQKGVGDFQEAPATQDTQLPLQLALSLDVAAEVAICLFRA